MIRKLCNWFKWKVKQLRMVRNPFICDRPMKYSLRRLLRLQKWAKDLYFKRRKLPMLKIHIILKKRSTQRKQKLFEQMQGRYLPRESFDSQKLSAYIGYMLN